MTRTPTIVDEAESVVRELAQNLLRVRPGECLCCYVGRQLVATGCDGSHRHAYRYRDAVAPRATALRDRLSRVGACCCDCELFMNGYQLHARFWTPAHEVEQDGDVFYVEAVEPEEVPPCAGVRRGSTQPCANWLRIRRRR